MAYRTAEFAKLTGVTVRTLQYYDRCGLLAPSQVTEAGHRLYERSDLVRLQQVLTLKWMGFSLKAIKAILDDPTYDLQTSLAIQEAAIRNEVERLRTVADLIGRVQEQARQMTAETVDTEMIRAIIQQIVQTDPGRWVEEYFSEAARAGLQTRWLAYSPQQIAEVEQAWAKLFEAFDQHLDDPPDSPPVQKLAAEMNRLVEMFTGGDPEVEAGMLQMEADAQHGKLPAKLAQHMPYEGVPQKRRALMQSALNIYRQRQKSAGKQTG